MAVVLPTNNPKIIFAELERAIDTFSTDAFREDIYYLTIWLAYLEVYG